MHMSDGINRNKKEDKDIKIFERNFEKNVREK